MTSIIIDGPDRCFKTTTISLFKRELALRGVYMPSYKAKDFSKLFAEQIAEKHDLFKNRLQFCTTTEVDMLKQLDFDVIFDRHYPSEFVYSKYYNRETNDTLLRQVDDDFVKCETKIFILCRQSYKGWQDNIDSTIDLSKVDMLYRQFINWSHNPNIHVIEVDAMSEADRIQLIYKLTFKGS
jgi:thymidylate kinase